MRKEEVQNLETKRGLRLLLELSLSHSSLIVSLLVVNLALAFFEGSSIGLFAVAVSVITGGPTLVVPPWLESIGGSFLQEILFIEQSALFIGLVAGGVLLQIAKSGVQYLSARLSIALRFEVTRKLQNRITEKVMSLSYTEIIRRPAGSLSESIRQAESVTVLVSNVNKVIQSIIMLVVYFSLMMIVSLELTFVAFVIVLSVGFGMTTLIRKLKRQICLG